MRIPPTWSRDATSGRSRSPIRREPTNPQYVVESSPRLAPRRHRVGKGGQSIVEFALVLPIMMLVLLAIIDFGRIYTTMMTVESAAREAADFGTTRGAEHWGDVTRPDTVADMQKRACIAASNLPDYVGDDPSGTVVTCTNPAFSCVLTAATAEPCLPYDPAPNCEFDQRDPPCLVTVTLTYDFHLFAPVIGLPTTITFDRDSTFAMTDIELAPTPAPTP